MNPPISLHVIQEALAGRAAAFRAVTDLYPAGGAGDKVFPPTYKGGIYAREKRRFPKSESGQQSEPGASSLEECVLLDSVQSQANRLEQSLLRAFQDQEIVFPLMTVDFAGRFPEIGSITALDAPHRIADAIFRDSLLNGIDFRHSREGMDFEKATMRNATAIYKACPTALLFGTWDSTGSKGGLGNKFARALVSEIIGIGCETGKRTSSRIDPLAIPVMDVYQERPTTDRNKAAKGCDGNPILYPWKVYRQAESPDWTCNEQSALKEGTGANAKPSVYEPSCVFQLCLGWTTEPAQAAVGKDDLPIRYSNPRKKSEAQDRGKPSAINHGNVTPDLARDKRKEPLEGGVTIARALQTSILSLPALRRLRFPVNGTHDIQRDRAAQAVLAAMALAALALQQQHGYDLRSRCLLIPGASTMGIEVVTSYSERAAYTLDTGAAIAAFDQAVVEATAHGLNWQAGEIRLEPSQALWEMVRASRNIATDDDSEDSTS